jgi:hypothetical protein
LWVFLGILYYRVARSYFSLFFDKVKTDEDENWLWLFSEAQFSSQKILQNFSDSPSHRIFGHMHEALNIDKK